MNFQNMEYFLTVAETGNITLAAKQLNISQQALSNCLARMESELGCRLFDRHSGLQLTYAGKQYRESVIRILDMNRQTRDILNDISQNIRGELRIGISHTWGQALLPLVLPEFIESHPEVELSVQEESARTLESLLDQGDIDVMIGFAPFMIRSATVFPLMKEHLCLVIPNDLLVRHFGDMENAGQILNNYKNSHDLNVLSEFPFILLKEGERIRTIMERIFHDEGFWPKIKLEARNIQTTVSLAAEGMGIAVCPDLYLNNPYILSGIMDTYIREKVAVVPIESAEASNNIVIGYNNDRYLSRIARDFIDLCCNKFQNNSDSN